MTELPRRLGLALVVLLFEYLLLSLLVDARAILPAAWVELGSMGPLPFVAGAVAFVWARRSDSPAPELPPPSRHLIAVHLLVFVAWLTFTWWAAQGTTTVIASAWLALSFVLGSTAVLAAVPASILKTWLLQRKAGLIGGILVGVIAFGTGIVAQSAFNPLAQLTLQPVAMLIQALQTDVVLRADEHIVGTQNFLVHIAPNCSGYEGMGLILALLVGFMVARRGDLRWSRVWLLPPLALLMMWAANVVRIVMLIELGDAGFRELAQSGFHSKIGWLLFTALALLLMGWVNGSGFWMKQTEQQSDSELYPKLLQHLLPLIVLFAGGLIGGLLLTNSGLRYAAAVVPAAAALIWSANTPGARSYLLKEWSWSSVGVGLGLGILWVITDSSVPGGQMPLAEQLLRCCASVVVVPVVEELAFRGFLMRRLHEENFWRVPLGDVSGFAVLTSALVFGLMHGRPLAAALAGLAYGLLARRHGRLSDAVVAHAATNAVIALVVVFTGHFGLR